MNKQARLKLKTNAGFDVSSLTSHTVRAMLQHINTHGNVDTSNSPTFRSLLRQMNVTGTRVVGSGNQRSQYLSEVYGMCNYFGLPSFMMSINPADLDSLQVCHGFQC